jgi:isopenicillin-N epimerase
MIYYRTHSLKSERTCSTRTGTTELRDLFLLRPDVIFLNHGSFGACPRPVFEVYQDWQRELECQPVEFLGRRFKRLMRGAREALGDFVGAGADNLIYVPNATTGLNLVARSLPLEPGDEVLATDHEYGALDRTWRFVCSRRGARYIRQRVPLPVTGVEQVVESLWSGVTDRTRILFISHITSPTAITMPVAELISRVQEAGIITVVDGAHAPGQVPMNLATLGADFYAGNCHKWMMAPKGSAFLYARREMQPVLQPLVVSWGWQSEIPGPSRFIDEQEYQGTRDIAAYMAVPAAIQFMGEYNWPDVQRECHQLVRYARRKITELTGSAPITPDTPTWFAQMETFPLPACDGEILQRRLYDEFAVEIPIIVWNGQRLLRISVQGYNTRGDVDMLIRALTELLPEVEHASRRGGGI